MSGSRRRVGRVAGSLLVMVGFVVLAPAAHAGVALNEVNCAGTDWVEIINTGPGPVDPEGWLLTDDPIDRSPPRSDHRFEFGATTIAPGGSLVVERASGGFPFGISCGSDTIRLADRDRGGVDEVTVPELTSEDLTWGRFPSGTGSWVETVPTKGTLNVPGDSPPGTDPAEWLYDPGVVVGVDLSLPPESRAALAADPREYQDASFSLTTDAGTYGPFEVGLHLKGWAGSFRDLTGKAAFKIKFNHDRGGGRFFGLKKLTLNNMVQDPSMVHETLAYEVFRAAGVPAPRTGFAYVRVDGDDYGLYLNVETPDDVFLRRWFPSTAHLCESFPGVDATSDGVNLFEVDEGDEDDRGDLEALVAAAAGGGDFSARMEERADLGEMTRMWAVERFIGHWDGYAGDSAIQPNNYFLHSDSSGRFSILPWGTDQTFGRRLPFVDEHGTLFAQCLDDDDCRSMYRAEVERLAGLTRGLELDDQVVETADLLAPWQAADPRREYSLAQIDAGVAATRSFLATRWADVFNRAFWGEPGDLYPPETKVTAGPPSRMSRPRGSTVAIRFASTEPGSTFQCRIDQRPWRDCRAPYSVRAGVGRRSVEVRATDIAGNTDATPAARAWRNAG